MAFPDDNCGQVPNELLGSDGVRMYSYLLHPQVELLHYEFGSSHQLDCLDSQAQKFSPSIGRMRGSLAYPSLSQVPPKTGVWWVSLRQSRERMGKHLCTSGRKALRLQIHEHVSTLLCSSRGSRARKGRMQKFHSLQHTRYILCI